MKCVVPSQNVKVLAKSFHSLGRIGEDLFIEPYKDHLIFRTVNMAESAYASFNFCKLFFSSYTFTEDDDEEVLRCKIAMKSLLVVLKSQHSERFLEWCQIRVDPNGTKVIFQLRYSYGCTKTHFLPIIESEHLQANYSKNDCPNRLSASPKLLSTAVKNFRMNEEEVTLSVMAEKLILRNHLENSVDSKKALRTEVGLFPGEFESYNISTPMSVTFCLKELRAVLFFAEYTGLPIQFYVNTAGKPVVFAISNESLYEADFVVSTLNESGIPQPFSQTSESSEASSRPHLNTKKRLLHEDDDFASSPQAKRPSCISPNPCTMPICPSPLSASMNGRADCLGDISGPHPSQCSDQTNIAIGSNVTQPVVRSVFGRCFNTTFRKQSLPGYSEVLAYDSDGMVDSD